MEASLKVMNTVAQGRKLAVLGDMLEMGGFSEECHRQVGRLVSENKVDLLVCVGESSRFMADEAEKYGVTVKWLESNALAAEYINDIVRKGDTLLFKASRGMRFETIASAVTEELKRKGSVECE